MPYLQLANGETKKLDNDEFKEMFGDEPPRVYRENGKELTIVGVHADEVEYEMTPEEKTAKREKKQAKKDKKANKENPDNTVSDEKAATE